MRKTFLFRLLRRFYYALFSSKQIADDIYFKRFGEKINWANPRNINEKINWLKFNSDTSQWTELADKYKVRDYVKRCGLEEILIPIYGVWNNASEIDFDKLPSTFVLKTNHGSGEIIVCKDKAKLNVDEAIKSLNEWMSESYGQYQGEPHYINIQRKIIAEKYLFENNPHSTLSVIDYKIWCFDGVPYYIWVCCNRTHESVYVELYDTSWNYLPQKSVFTDHYRDNGGKVPKPNDLDKMLSIASILSKGFPQVRVDLYRCDDVIYFGEMTFTSSGGYMDFYTKEFLDELGSLIKLPNDER